jgi:hypothetical protein
MLLFTPPHSLIMEKICYQIPSSLTVYRRFMLYCNFLIIHNTCSLLLFVDIFPIFLLLVIVGADGAIKLRTISFGK